MQLADMIRGPDFTQALATGTAGKPATRNGGNAKQPQQRPSEPDAHARVRERMQQMAQQSACETLRNTAGDCDRATGRETDKHSPRTFKITGCGDDVLQPATGSESRPGGVRIPDQGMLRRADEELAKNDRVFDCPNCGVRVLLATMFSQFTNEPRLAEPVI